MTCAHTAEAPQRDPAVCSPRVVDTAMCGALSAEEVELRTQLQEVREELAAMDAMESRALMRFEDEFACCRRMLEAREREIDTLERQLVDAECSGYFEVGNSVVDATNSLTRELEAVDAETHVLTSDMQLWEHTVAGLRLDLSSSLEYFFTGCNEGDGCGRWRCCDLSGGPLRCSGLKGFPPHDLCATLDLSDYCIPHISNLMEEERRAIMPRRSSVTSETTIISEFSGYSRHHSSRQGSKSKRQNSVDRKQQHRLLGPGLDSQPPRLFGPGLDSQPPVGLLGAGLEVVNTPSMPRRLSVSSTKPSTGFRTSSSEQDEDAMRPPLVAVDFGEDDDGLWSSDEESVEDLQADDFRGKKSVDLLAEGHLLREGLAEELRQLDALLVPPAAGMGLEARLPMRDLLRAAARGDVSAVKVWLPCVEGARGEQRDRFLGWTAWHIAAAFGQCGVLECLKEDLVESAKHYLAALDQPTSILGLPPLGVACIRGQIEAVRSLLLCMAPVSSRDVRGNTPLLWAAASDKAQLLVPLLLDSRGDPAVANGSGQRIDIEAYHRPRNEWPLVAQPGLQYQGRTPEKEEPVSLHGGVLHDIGVSEL